MCGPDLRVPSRDCNAGWVGPWGRDACLEMRGPWTGQTAHSGNLMRLSSGTAGTSLTPPTPSRPHFLRLSSHILCSFFFSNFIFRGTVSPECLWQVSSSLANLQGTCASPIVSSRQGTVKGISGVPHDVRARQRLSHEQGVSRVQGQGGHRLTPLAYG